MIVIKFGGSSVGTAESIKVVGDVLIEKSVKTIVLWLFQLLVE